MMIMAAMSPKWNGTECKNEKSHTEGRKHKGKRKEKHFH